MTVTAVEPRRKGLSALYIDGEFAMKLSTEILIKHRISAGYELCDEELHEIVEESDLHRAKEKAMWLISYRDHSSKELYEKLRRDFSESSCERAVERMTELGLINDEAFAARYCEELHAKHCSPSDIMYKLREKGIDKEQAQELVEELCIDPVEEITAIVERRYLNVLSDDKGKARTVNALRRKGFRYDDIKTALKNIIGDGELPC